MNIPSLPTDNLYKLMAMSGVFIVAISLFLWASSISGLNQSIIEVSTKIKIYELKKEALEHKKISGKIDTQLQDKIDNIFFQIQGNALKNKLLLEDIKVNSLIALSVILLGVFLSYLGFTLWYSRVQKYHDTILASQAEQLFKSSPTKRSNSDNNT